jgi:dihydroorotase
VGGSRNGERAGWLAAKIGVSASPATPFRLTSPQRLNMTTPTQLTLIRPDDWHLHLRDGAAMASVVPATAQQFARAIVMPNLRPPVTTAEQAVAYRDRIRAAVPAGLNFEPLMVLYLTDNTPVDEVKRAKEAGVVAFKLYPAGATTNSDAGVTDLRKTHKVLEAMQREGLVFCVHGEVTDSEVDVFDREKAFIDDKLIPLRRDFPELKVAFEHITTKEAAQYVTEADHFVGATITPQHLLYNRNAIFMGGIRPHYYCLPILKREEHRLALVQAATSGSPKFFLGTDSAPHASYLKEHASGCAGCYSAPSAMELYAEAFEAAGALDKLEGFASLHGPDYYGLPRNTDTVTLVREDWVVPEELPFGEAVIKPLRGGETLRWKLR